MTDSSPDAATLARRYLDLWQQQVAALSSDPAMAEAVARGVAMMTSCATAMVEAAGLGGTTTNPNNDKARTDESAASPTSQPGSVTRPQDRPAPVAAPPADPSCDPVRLALRLAALEERVVVLEAAFGRTGERSEGKPRRRRS
ncbi:conserved hypothetical protein [Magnetospirillum molischianum DSM 120]|uniref:Uncharacterized protein n=1 Tax=Magnetospirillum molischianum DSM 120 TaxID=1150626 RepID=H8FWY7_MAGML|nr:conserved hypothetical protein [Magnetospirillum molischianum DSM 120]